MIRYPMLMTCFLLGATDSTTHADPLPFDFKDPKGVNTLTFLLDSPLEPIVGYANGLSGTVLFDPQKPDTLSGHLILSASSVQTPIPMMSKTLHTADWLNVEKYPTIELSFKDFKGTKKISENEYEAKLQADLMIMGKTQKVDVTAKATYLPGKLGDRVPNTKGDLLVVRANFGLSRKEFGIQAGQHLEKVADQIQVQAYIVGIRPESE
ncbi:YceI family protein [bacterium]|nr:YceI family protein [bacterium]MBV6482875.1 hypothetical protein [bacterium]MCK6495460.1 YceI family protein [bacterium]NUP93010.1 YceI family protein [Candidatus Omnitrophota bacterium]